jgi:hypothetical protein
VSDRIETGPPASQPPPGAPPPSPPPAPSAEAPPPTSQVDDADDLRSFHLRRLLGLTVTRVLLAIFSIAAAVGGFLLIGAAGALIGFGASLLVGLLVVFFIADSASEEAFFTIYAQQRGMQRTGGSLPRATPLLRKGDERETNELIAGPIGDGIDGALALYTYTDVYHDKDGRHETDYPFTVALVDVSECKVHGLFCNRKSGFSFLEGVEDAFRRNERVRLESAEMADEYEVFMDKDEDPNWIRQLFSPTFIVWLTESAPGKFAFELEDGTLCCSVKGHKKDAAQLDGMRDAAAAVATRVREEVAEGPSPVGA